MLHHTHTASNRNVHKPDKLSTHNTLMKHVLIQKLSDGNSVDDPDQFVVTHPFNADSHASITITVTEADKDKILRMCVGIQSEEVHQE